MGRESNGNETNHDELKNLLLLFVFKVAQVHLRLENGCPRRRGCSGLCCTQASQRNFLNVKPFGFKPLGQGSENIN